MSALRHEVQREVFASSGERVVAVCEVHKPYKKKKTCVLCVVRGPTLNDAHVVQVSRTPWRRKRSWPISEVRIVDAAPDSSGTTLELMADKLYSWVCAGAEERREWARALAAAAPPPAPTANATRPAHHTHHPGSAGDDEASAEEAEREGLAALAHLDAEELGGGGGGEAWVRRLGERAAALERLNVQGLLAAEAGGARLLQRLERGAELAEAAAARRERYEAALRASAEPMAARGAAAEAGARRLLAELADLAAWLDPPNLRAVLDADVSLATVDGRARALRAAEALRTVLEAVNSRPAYQLRLGAVQERLRRLGKTRDQLAAAVARHLNNLLIHLGNEAWQESPAAAPHTPPSRRHHAELMPYAPFMRWLRAMDERSYRGLAKVYVGSWARVYEREARSLCDEARAHMQPADVSHAPAPGPGTAGGGAGAASALDVDAALDQVAARLEASCDAEQDFCAEFFCLESEGVGGPEGAAEARKLMSELFSPAEGELLSLLAHVERHEPYGAMHALACLGRRVLGSSGAAGAGDARWSRALLAAAVVAAKRGADRLVSERLAALADAGRPAARRQKCGVLPALHDFEELTAACESIFARGGRRADVERWYGALAEGLLRAIAAAEHPRTPRAVLQLENYHRLHGLLSALRLPALDPARREARQRYNDALRAYVTQYFGRPLEKLNEFFEGVAEAVASGVRAEEVCYRAAFSKHELRRVLALYPREEVRRALHRLYRTVEKHLSEEQGLLQVVWRAMQEEFLEQHKALEARLTACYAGAGLALPLSTRDILDAFSDMARSH